MALVCAFFSYARVRVCKREKDGERWEKERKREKEGEKERRKESISREPAAKRWILIMGLIYSPMDVR